MEIEYVRYPQGDLNQVQAKSFNLIILCNVIMVSLSLSKVKSLSLWNSIADTEGP